MILSKKKLSVQFMNFKLFVLSSSIELLNQDYDDHIHLYKPNFSYKSSYTSFEDDLLKWCNQATADTNGFNVESLENAVLESETIGINNIKDDQTRHSRQIQVMNYCLIIHISKLFKTISCFVLQIYFIVCPG